MRGAKRTVRVAGALVAVPTRLLTIAVRTAPFSDAAVGWKTMVGDVAPERSTPLNCHRYERGGVPMAATENVAGRGSSTVAETGSVVMTGACNTSRSAV